MRNRKTRFGLRALGKRNLTLSEINLWGLFGVLLVLLMILMMALPVPHGWTLDRIPALHAAPMPGALKEDAMRITVTRDGSIYFRNSKIALTDLPKLIGEDIKNGAEKRIYLVVDARAKYQEVEPVLDQIRLAGIQDVTFLTDQPYIHR